MTAPAIQSSFAAGELSPTLFARVDLAKYHTGLKLCRNMFVDYRGGVSTRAGTQYVAETLYSNYPVKLREFQFSTLQTYVLEFGHFYMRVIKDGGLVIDRVLTLSAVTTGSDPVFTSAAHTMSTGDWVQILGVPGLNPDFYQVVSVTTNTFKVKSLSGHVITNGTTYTSGGSAGVVYRITTPYDSADVGQLKFTQSADTLTIVHPSYPPADLTRTAHNAWTLTPISFASVINPPASLDFYEPTGGSTFYNYGVTSIDAEGNESIHRLRTFDNRVNMGATAGSFEISWPAVTGAVAYNIYRTIPSFIAIPPDATLAYVGRSEGVIFIDTNITPDFSKSPPTHDNPFVGTGNYPSAVIYHQQRKVYAGTNNNPDKFWMSQPGSFKNFDKSIPIRDDNVISGTLASTQVNNIKSLVSMPSGLIALTGGGAWQISGGSADTALTPKSVTAKPQAYTGVSDLIPIVINYDILYVQALGSIVRDLSYNFYANVYTGVDLTVLSNHFFYRRKLVSWAYCEEPFKIVWAVRDDGKLLSLTFLKEQDIYGWALHETNGTFESVVSIPEDEEYHAYFVVKRTIDGRDVRIIERMASRGFDTLADAWCVDCGFSYTGTPVSSLNILGALEGRTVAVLADGVAQSPKVVTNGTIAISPPASKIIVGLPYTCQGQTLNLEVGEPTAQGRRKKVSAVTLRVDNSVGLKTGRDFNHLQPVKQTGLFSGDERVILEPGWENTGSVCWQQDGPYPASVLGIIPEVSIGDNSR